MSQSTVQIPVGTIEKIAALGKAMLSLAESLQKHTSEQHAHAFSIPIPDLIRPDTMPQGEEWFWSDEWQSKEREANADLKTGQYKTFNTIE